MDGYGEFVWAEGKKYCGFYKDDKKDGFGLYYWHGDKFFIGFWKEGKQNGFGKYIKGNNIKYGLWKDGKKEKWFEDENDFSRAISPENEKFLALFFKDINELKRDMQIDK